MGSHKFKVGEIVRLKSGGPEMTVQDPKNFNGQVACSWFAGKKLEHGNFAEESLDAATEPVKPA